MRLFVIATALAVACAANAAAQSGRRVKPPEPAASPAPDEQAEQQREAARQQQQGGARAATGEATGDGDAKAELDEAGNRVYVGRQVDQRARLLSRPEPAYPRQARRNGVRGVVRLRVVLAASGKVEKISVIRGLPDGLTEEAIRAARGIKFLPAEKDARRVSQWAIIEYNFNFY